MFFRKLPAVIVSLPVSPIMNMMDIFMLAMMVKKGLLAMITILM